jgi:hypothetical protein
VKWEIEREIINLDIEKIDFDDKELLKRLFLLLLNRIELQAREIQLLREQNQLLKDENAYLKGEKGKPKIPPNVPPRDKSPKTVKSKKWSKSSKKSDIKINREVHIEVDKTILPSDAVFVGERKVVIQNIVIKTDNVAYYLKRYYSRSLNKVFEAELPEDVKSSQFGAGLKSIVAYLHYKCRVPQNKIFDLLTDIGVVISEGTISNILTSDKANEFFAERISILEAGMLKSKYLQADESGARHRGRNCYLHVICNDMFSFFTIKDNKSRSTIHEILGLEYHEKLEIPFVTDDGARQYLDVSKRHAKCWIHEIRHYKKLMPFLDHHRSLLDKVMDQLWGLFDLLIRYKNHPDKSLRVIIEWKFNWLFSRRTGYTDLDERLASTDANRDGLLKVLDYPFIPIHNNAAEIAIREGVVKRKISYGTRSEMGKRAWENMFSIMDTCRKQEVNFFHYLNGIFSSRNDLPKLANLIYNTV